jgi:hypothetical protein
MPNKYGLRPRVKYNQKGILDKVLERLAPSRSAGLFCCSPVRLLGTNSALQTTIRDRVGMYVHSLTVDQFEHQYFLPSSTYRLVAPKKINFLRKMILFNSYIDNFIEISVILYHIPTIVSDSDISTAYFLLTTTRI